LKGALRKSIVSLAAGLVLATVAGNALAAVGAHAAPKATPQKRVVTVKKTVNGAKVECYGRGNKDWGPLVVALAVKKTTTTIGTRSTVKVEITDVLFPIYPDHTSRSIYINKQALPLLKEETLQLQLATATRLEMISGATDTTVAFQKSVKPALLALKTI
jgi:hypothetical protein